MKCNYCGNDDSKMISEIRRWASIDKLFIAYLCDICSKVTIAEENKNASD